MIKYKQSSFCCQLFLVVKHNFKFFFITNDKRNLELILFLPMRLERLLEKKARSNASSITIELLKRLQVPVTASSVIDSLEEHPDYPSLYSISDSLQKWKVDNLALKVKAEALEELPTPFIAHS